jgi:hypothetical protein
VIIGFLFSKLSIAIVCSFIAARAITWAIPTCSHGLLTKQLVQQLLH